MADNVISKTILGDDFKTYREITVRVDLESLVNLRAIHGDKGVLSVKELAVNGFMEELDKVADDPMKYLREAMGEKP